MRISTAQMYNTHVTGLNRQESNMNKTLIQIQSGKRIDTAGDDPVAAVGIGNINYHSSVLNQYKNNIIYATNRTSSTESKLGLIVNYSYSIRESVASAVNGTLDDTDRNDIVTDIKSKLKTMVELANAKDENGNYIFSGTKTNTAPFSTNNSGTVVYNGDNGVRHATVSTGVDVPVNIPGSDIFLNGPSGTTPFAPVYNASQQGNLAVDSAKVKDPGGAYTPVGYDFAFSGTPVDTVNITDSNGVAIFSGAFDSGVTPLTFNDSVNGDANTSISINFSGAPKDGDSMSLNYSPTQSMFDTINDAMSLLSDSSRLNSPQGTSELATILNNLNANSTQISTMRGQAGNVLKQLDTFTNNYSEESVIDETSLSSLQDTDMATALSKFTLQQNAYEASAKVFSQLNQTSLFSYI